MKTCPQCGHEITAEKIMIRDECSSCGADLHVCLNCLFYDQTRSKACREPQAELVKEKDRSNYCDYFQCRESGETNRTDPAKDRAEKLWKELFKK